MESYIEENKNQESLEKIKKDDKNRLEYNDVHHFNELIKEILDYYKQDGYDKFEQISMFIKRKLTKLSFQYYVPKEIQKSNLDITPYEEKLFSELNKKKPKQLETIENYIEDVLSISRIMEWAGISFGKNQWFKIRLAMKKLMIESNVSKIRFWGKIYGLNADYYIIQGTMKNIPLPIMQPYIESRGNEGLNRYIFWVSNSILEDWYELPDINSEQFLASQKFKYYFTGDLNSKVKSFNPFPGKESHLLKCQIIRIMHSSCIVPEGYLRANTKYEGDLADKVTEYNDEFQMPPFEEMKQLNKWVHEYAYINPKGKIIDTSEDAVQVERMRNIEQDEGYKIVVGENEEEIKYWLIKIVGEELPYSNEKQDGVNIYAAIVLKNSRWPGSICVWKNGEFSNIYLGNAIKSGGDLFIPTQPGEIEKDPEGGDEYPEPYPLTEPQIKEPDTDEVKEQVEDEEN